jgi:hypothetical protein
VRRVEHPIHDEPVEDEGDAEERLPEADGRMFVVVARIARSIVRVLVAAEEGGDLHKGVKALKR